MGGRGGRGANGSRATISRRCRQVVRQLPKCVQHAAEQRLRVLESNALLVRLRLDPGRPAVITDGQAFTPHTRNQRPLATSLSQGGQRRLARLALEISGFDYEVSSRVRVATLRPKQRPAEAVLPIRRSPPPQGHPAHTETDRVDDPTLTQPSRHVRLAGTCPPCLLEVRIGRYGPNERFHFLKGQE